MLWARTATDPDPPEKKTTTFPQTPYVKVRGPTFKAKESGREKMGKREKTEKQRKREKGAENRRTP